MSSNSLVVFRNLARRRPFANQVLRSNRCSSSYSVYEYPLAKEPPEITRTKAKEAEKNPRSWQRPAPRLSEDRFDDAQTLTPQQIEEIRSEQRKKLNTRLSSAYAITNEVPASIPPNFSSDQLEVPETVVTTLDNGIRVVSQETYGQVSTIGAVCEVGSRLERSGETGVTNLLEVLAFGATKKYMGPQVNTLLQDWGGQRFVSTGREQSLHCIDLLRPNVENALDLLKEVLLEAKFLPEEVEDAKMALGFQAMDMMPELLLGEALQEAAYGANQQLGQPHFCPAEALAELSADTVHGYWQRQFVQNPKGLVIGGAGVRHDFLVKKAEELFGHLKQNDEGRSIVQPSQYRGGEKRVERPTVDGLVRIGVGFEVGGWHSDALVATCVLQTLLGGGSSFSAGGPGKGMYSRLYRRVLNQFGWAESAEAYTAFHSESGIWGISGSTLPENARNMVQVFTHHLAQLAVNHVSDEELDRARNMLKCNVLTQLESRLVLFEDMGRQVLTYGLRENMNVTCKKIDAVTKEDLRQVAMKALEHPPCLASVGSDLSHVPRHDELVAWLG
jgi:processing peptidase subunit alpha